MENILGTALPKTDFPSYDTERAYKFLVSLDHIIPVMDECSRMNTKREYNYWLKNYCLTRGGFTEKDLKVIDWDAISTALFIVFVALNDALGDEDEPI